MTTKDQEESAEVELKQVPTDDLIAELASRENVKRISTGPYKGHVLFPTHERMGKQEVRCATVLLIDPEYRHLPSH